LLELVDYAGRVVIAGSTGHWGSQNTQQQLVCSDSAEVRNRLCPTGQTLEIAPIKVDILEIGESSRSHFVPVIIGLRLIEIDG